jgi:hypothetical protein
MVVALNEFRALVASLQSGISIGLRRPNSPPTKLDGGVAKEMIRCDTETYTVTHRLSSLSSAKFQHLTVFAQSLNSSPLR